ncbi:hypothetical protein KY386_03815 [Candidatus Parcubacteria bacterium]|nr:hypothetical protein [Candidatus Parcubacteria bacterium]
MELRGVEYGRVFCAPGARGFFGEGYWYQRVFRLFFGRGLRRATFVGKTTTWHPRLNPEKKQGNMPLRDDNITPKELRPKSIVINWRKAHVVNAVGLSGPGARYLLEHGKRRWLRRPLRWQDRIKPFMISFMPIAPTKAERLQQLRDFVSLLARYLPEFKAPVALQLNFACPNTGEAPAELFGEIDESFDIAEHLGIAVLANFNPVVPLQVARRTADHPACYGLWIANSVPWGDPRIDWLELFDTLVSPLAHLGGGGLSGPRCLPLSISKLVELRQAGVTKPIIIGNGIQTKQAAEWAFRAGADGIALGIVGMVRPWRMRSIIKAANEHRAA